MSHVKTTTILDIVGYDIRCTRFADAILDLHFGDAKNELLSILNDFRVREDHVMRGGGGKSLITQDLEKLMLARQWEPRKVKTNLLIGDQKKIPRISHEIDHFKQFGAGNIGLEIEWNNKNPFFDRDLQQFRWGHEIEEQALGIIITRGNSLQVELEQVIVRALTALDPFNMETLDNTIDFSKKAGAKVNNIVKKSGREGIGQIARVIHSSKYGTSTTHMSKLLEHVERGAGDPCPLILIGIEKERLTAAPQGQHAVLLEIGVATDVGDEEEEGEEDIDEN
jgi:hypothetical protein